MPNFRAPAKNNMGIELFVESERIRAVEILPTRSTKIIKLGVRGQFFFIIRPRTDNAGIYLAFCRFFKSLFLLRKIKA